MHSVLVCVRTTAAARQITAHAARMGVTAAARTALSEHEALARLAERPADVVLVDAGVWPHSVDFTRRLLHRNPGTAVVLVGVEDSRLAAAAVTAGARGVIRTGGCGDYLVTALTRGILMVCRSGQPPVPVQRRLPGGRLPNLLTNRERQVLLAMSEGCSNAEIGRQLCVSEDTVKTHARRLYRKLGVHDRAHAVAAAFRAGLVF